MKNPGKTNKINSFQDFAGEEILLVIFSSSAIGSTVPVVQQHFLEEEYESHKQLPFTAWVLSECLWVPAVTSRWLLTH